MLLDLLYQCGLLLVVILAAFAVSAAVGMAIGRVVATPDPEVRPAEVPIAAHIEAPQTIESVPPIRRSSSRATAR